MSVAVNGIAHIQLTVSDPARCVPFWEQLCHLLEMQTLVKGDDIVYCIGSRTGILVRGAPPEKRASRFDQDRPGLHHLCLRARSREDIHRLHDLLREMGATIIHAPQDGTWAPGYYSVLFEDPDGIRLEANFVPGAGVLAAGVKFNPSEGYQS